MLCLLFLALEGFGQGAIKGFIYDAGNKEPVVFSYVYVYQDGALIAGGTSDFDGKFFIAYVEAGEYEIMVPYTGYDTTWVEKVIVENGETLEVNVPMQLKEVEMDGKVILFDLQALPQPDSIAENEVIRGPAGGGNATYYIDGVRVGTVLLSETKKLQRKARREQRKRDRKYRRTQRKMQR